MSWKKIFNSNIFILKEFMPHIKGRLLIGIFVSSLGGISSFFKDVLLIKLLIDGLINRVDFFNLVLYVLFVFAFDIFVNIISKYYNLYLIKTNAKLSKIFTHKIILKIQSIENKIYENPEFYDEYKKTLEKGDSICINLIRSLNSAISSCIVIFGIVAYAITLNNIVILISVVVCILSFFLNNTVIKNNYNLYEKTVNVNRKIDYIERIHSVPEYAEELKAQNMYDFLINKFNQYFNKVINIKKTFLKKNAILEFISDSIPYIAVYFIISLYSAYKIYNNMLSIGDFVSINNAAFQLIFRCNLIVKRTSEINENSLFISNYKKFMEYESTMKEGDVEANTNIKTGFKIENLSFSYDGNKQVLTNISMQIKPGEKIAIVGLNGAGKTTFIKLLMRLYDPDNGSILLDDINIKNYTIDSYHKLFGTVFQDFKQYAFSVKENICFDSSNSISDKEIYNVLESVGLSEKIKSHKDNIFAEVGNEFSDGINFSGGESQKLAIARAIAKESPIIVLDEASSALDPISEHNINTMMLQVFESKTIIIISHRLSTVINADKIYYFKNGQIIEQGTHRELIHAKGHYYKLFTTQAEQYGIIF